MSKSSKSVSSNSIPRFLNFAVKIKKNRTFNPTGIGNEGGGLVAVDNAGQRLIVCDLLLSAIVCRVDVAIINEPRHVISDNVVF